MQDKLNKNRQSISRERANERNKQVYQQIKTRIQKKTSQDEKKISKQHKEEKSLQNCQKDKLTQQQSPVTVQYLQSDVSYVDKSGKQNLTQQIIPSYTIEKNQEAESKKRVEQFQDVAPRPYNQIEIKQKPKILQNEAKEDQDKTSEIQMSVDKERDGHMQNIQEFFSVNIHSRIAKMEKLLEKSIKILSIHKQYLENTKNQVDQQSQFTPQEQEKIVAPIEKKIPQDFKSKSVERQRIITTEAKVQSQGVQKASGHISYQSPEKIQSSQSNACVSTQDQKRKSDNQNQKQVITPKEQKNSTQQQKQNQAQGKLRYLYNLHQAYSAKNKGIKTTPLRPGHISPDSKTNLNSIPITSSKQSLPLKNQQTSNQNQHQGDNYQSRNL